MVKDSKRLSLNEIAIANVSIEDMYNKYIKTIDVFRSLSRPPNYESASSVKPKDPKKYSVYPVSKDLNISEFQESRAHAFYRMVGFPIISKSKFYNPGYNPRIESISKYNDVVNAFFNDYPDLVKIIIKREKSFRDKINIFRNKDNLSVIYAGAIPIIKKFNVIDGDPGDPLKPNEQDSNISERREYLNNNKYDLTGPQQDLQKKYISGCPHILKPFIVHPLIANSVLPDEKMLAVPFLPNATDLNMSDTKVAKRTIIELILSARLSEEKISDTEKAELDRQLSKDLSGKSVNDQITIMQSIGGENDFEALKNDKDLINSIKNYNDLERKTIDMFSESIKSLVVQLRNYISIWNEINTSIQLEPVPNTYGPEFGGVSRVSLNEPSNTDVQIAYMQLKQAVAQGTPQIQLSSYAQSSGLDGSLKKDNTSDLNTLVKKRSDQISKAMQALKIIEIITGDVSGLGLIDVLAVHLALWSIDIRYLLGFLDSEAIQRCKNFDGGKFVNAELETQAGGNRPSITECLQQFEKIFFNVLSFADSTFSNTAANPTRIIIKK